MRGKTLVLAVACSAAVAACGGGSSSGDGSAADTGAAGTAAAAFGSVDAFMAFVRQVVASNGDTAEPVALPASAAPAADTSEPAPI